MKTPRTPRPPVSPEIQRAEINFDIEEAIKAGNIAHIEDVDGELTWKGDEEWPVFIGYPFVRVDDIQSVEKIGDEEVKTVKRAPEMLDQLPWELKAIRKDAPTQCWVFVRA